MHRPDKTLHRFCSQEPNIYRTMLHMDDVHAALLAAWERIRPTLERKLAELHRRLARRASALMRQHPRAWCLAIRATDTRLERLATIRPSLATDRPALRPPVCVSGRCSNVLKNIRTATGSVHPAPRQAR